MNDYKKEITPENTGGISMNVKNFNIEIAWPNQLIDKTRKGSILEEHNNYRLDPTQISNVKEDKIMFSGDTGIAFTRTEDIIHKLQTYDQTTQNNYLLINLGKVFILTTSKNKTMQKIILDPPTHIIR